MSIAYRLDAQHFSTPLMLALAVVDLAIREYDTHPHRISVEDVWVIIDTCDIERGDCDDNTFSACIAVSLKRRAVENKRNLGIEDYADAIHGKDISGIGDDVMPAIAKPTLGFNKTTEKLFRAGYYATSGDLLHWAKGNSCAEIWYNDVTSDFDILFSKQGAIASDDVLLENRLLSVEAQLNNALLTRNYSTETIDRYLSTITIVAERTARLETCVRKLDTALFISLTIGGIAAIAETAHFIAWVLN